MRDARLVTFEFQAGSEVSGPVDLNCQLYGDGEGTGVSVEYALLRTELVPDHNRDGKIDDSDRGRVTEDHPWRFWLNDDDDALETEGTDIPQGIDAKDTNGKNHNVDGVRDLVDFFPLFTDLRQLLQVFPTSEHRYRLTLPGTTEDPVMKVVEAVELVPGESGACLKSLPTARRHAYKESLAVHFTGHLLSNAFLDAAERGGGLLLLEAVKPFEGALKLTIQRKSDGKTLVEVPFHVKTGPVMDMFRWKYVMPMADDLTAGDIPGDPPNWPDADRNGKHFVFVHGYNVNAEQSKGWGAEVFKRMFWSGSNARFSAFAWRGYQSQIPHPFKPPTEKITPDYQINLDHAFGTAKSFKQFLDLLEGETTVAAHSMGNILVGSAMHDWGARPKAYIMLNSAAAKECYDATEAGDAAQDEMMENMVWRVYDGEHRKLRASEWHALATSRGTPIWPASDWRSRLTWRNRLRGVIDNDGLTDVYNFYSSGEEILNNAKLDVPKTNVTAGVWTTPNYVWAVQEKRKGYGLTGQVLTSNHGGWAFNKYPYDEALHSIILNAGWEMKNPLEIPSPYSTAFLIHLTTNPFFNMSGHATLFDPQTGDGSPGSDYAQQHRNTIISQMIPCTTFAAGRNEFLNPATSLPASKQFDMDATMKTEPNEWPESDAHDEEDEKPRPWLHSDIREKAFTHNRKAYAKFTEIGQLDSK